ADPAPVAGTRFRTPQLGQPPVGSADDAGLAGPLSRRRGRRTGYRSMKILLLVSSMHAGGAERVAATLVNAWTDRGDTVTLVPTYSSKGICFYPLSDAVDLIWLADRAGTRSSGPMGAWVRLRALRSLIREKAPDVVVSFLTNV